MQGKISKKIAIFGYRYCQLVSARKLKSLGSARKLPSSGSLELENSGSGSSLIFILQNWHKPKLLELCKKKGL